MKSRLQPRGLHLEHGQGIESRGCHYLSANLKVDCKLERGSFPRCHHHPSLPPLAVPNSPHPRPPGHSLQTNSGYCYHIPLRRSHMSYSAHSAINQRPLAKESLRQSKTIEYHIPARASVQDYQPRALDHPVEPKTYIPSRKAPAPPTSSFRPKTPTDSHLPPPSASSLPTSPRGRNSLQKPNPRARRNSPASTSTPSPRIVEQDPFAPNSFDTPLTQHLKSQRSSPMPAPTSPPPRPSRANTANLADILPGSGPQLFDDPPFYADPTESMPPTPNEFNPASSNASSRIRSRSGTASKSKKGVLGLMSEMFNPTKRPEISTPYDPVHLTHVGFNSSTGEFTGLPKEWQQLLQESGISRSEQEKNPQAVMEIVKFYQEANSDRWDKLGNVGGIQDYPPKTEDNYQNPVRFSNLSCFIVINHSFQRSPPPPSAPPSRKQSVANTALTNGPSAYRPAPTPPTPATPALDRSTSQRTPVKVTKPADLGRANTTRERDRRSLEKKPPIQPKPTSAKPSPVSSTSDLPLKQHGANSAARERDPRAQQNQATPSAAASSLAKVSGVATPRRRDKKEKDRVKEDDVIKRLQQICTDADPTKLYRNLVKIGQG